jgi:hypothetical protein
MYLDNCLLNSFIFAKYNKHYQNTNSKQLQLTTVYLLTLKTEGQSCAIFDILL